MNKAKPQINCPSFHDCPYTGRSVGIAILDTGIMPHKDFDNRIAVFKDFVKQRQSLYDDCGHGTHIAGIIAGSGQESDGRYQGMAPGSHIIALKVLDKRGNGYAVDVLAAISWLIANKDQYQIRIVNISVGSLGRKNMTEGSPLVQAVNKAWDAGLVVVVAAGNNGPGRMTITTPGISRKVITVGCSDDYKEVIVGGNRMVDYSGRGPTAACIQKPDVVAPGCSIVSCSNHGDSYAIKSGTSMSTPLVSGAVALLLEKEPALTNLDVKLKLRESSTDLGLSPNQQGWGLLNVSKLLG